MALYAFDGTWQEGKTGDDPKFTNTNVFRFFERYQKRSGTSDVYVAGIGTRFDAIGRALGGAFGIGELPRLLESYQSLCANWANGDRIIDIVGFSRGAATTLDFCHIIQKRGIRRPGTDDVVEMIQDHRALDQRLAIVKHQRRHPPQRIIGRDLVGIAEGRPRLVLEGDAVEPHGDGDAADEGGVVLADEDHGGLL